jgi:hypothetical protein
MKNYILLFFLLIFISCQDFGRLKLVADLPNELKEVSGTEIVENSELIWMLNDSGNRSRIYGISNQGKIKKKVDIQAKNHDWEDLTSDNEGNLFIGDFGNNANKRKNLVILKVDKKYFNKRKGKVERIAFSYPNQTKFPPKKSRLFFDSESFFYFNNWLYIFTKSRVKNKFGKTFLYKIPAKKGKYIAEFIGEFNNCKDLECWITSADISPDKSKVVLLSQKNVLIFSNFENDNFFSGTLEKIELKHRSQKEGISFKDNNTLLITDEKAHGTGGKLYELNLN